MFDGSIYLLSIAVAFLVYNLSKYILRKIYRKEPPGPSCWPIIGYYYKLGDHPQITFMQLAQKYGNIFQIPIGQYKAVILNGYDINKEAFSKMATDFASRPSLYTLNWLVKEGADYFGEYSETFKLSRKVTLKALSEVTSMKNEHFQYTIMESVTEFMETLKSKENKYFDPTTAIIRMAGYITFKVLYGKHAPDIDNPEMMDMMMIGSTFEADLDETAHLDSFPWMDYFCGVKLHNWQNFFLRLKQFVYAQIEKQMNDSKNDKNITDFFIDATKTFNENISLDVATGDLAVLTEAGVGTTTPTLLWAFLLLASHQNIQSDLHKELDLNLGSDDYVTWEYFNKLPFLEACILEIHRYSSILPLSAVRSATKDLWFHGYFISKGTAVINNLWSIHRDKTVWEKPDEFNPYRFLIRNENKINQNLASKVMAFSGGRRRCPAELMSRLVIFPIIGTVLLNFHLDCDEEAKLLFADFPFKGIAKPRSFNLIAKRRN